MAKIFILDDDQERLNEFINNLFKGFSDDLYIARTYEQAISLLDLTNYDVLFLDHDLGETPEIIRGSDGKTIERNGTGVAKWLTENLRNVPIIVVHSWNSSAANRMCQIFTDRNIPVIRAPFYVGNFLNIIDKIRQRFGMLYKK